MSSKHEMAIAKAALVLTAIVLHACSLAQVAPTDNQHGSFQIDSLGLPQSKANALQQMLDAHDYVKAESILLAEIQMAQQPAYKYRLLQVIGGVYFLDHDDLHAAVAWKKAEGIAPLPAPLQFSLAMAYIRLEHRDWARTQLQSLAAADVKNAIYPYWLGRIDYDEHAYEDAIAQFQKAIRLDQGMARAYDNLGLCFFYRNENTLAVTNFEKAIVLDRNTMHPSAWPHINLAAALQVLGRSSEAETNLREAIQLEPGIASAHFQLGNLLDSRGDTGAAMEEYQQAAKLDSTYAEPHFALARVYRRLGEDALAHQEVEVFQRLHNASSHRPAVR